MSFVPGTLVVLAASRKLHCMHLLKLWVKQMMKCCAPIRRGVIPQYYCELDTFYIFAIEYHSTETLQAKVDYF